MGHIAAALTWFFLLVGYSYASAQAKASRVFLLEDAGNGQWCSYTNEATWRAKVQVLGARTVGSLAYLNDHMSKIDITEIDESGDWTVYDHYLLNDHGQLVKLSRLINVLPGDRSVLQTFSIGNGKARKSATAEKHLSTGKPATSLPDWLPDIPIVTAVGMFPFSGLLRYPELRTTGTFCMRTIAKP